MTTSLGTIHHLELWVADLDAARSSIGWLLEALGYHVADSWGGGASWANGVTYVVLEAGTDVHGERHERRRPGMNHLAFHAGTRADVDALTRDAQAHGWSLLFGDLHPHAGGAGHYASYLEDGAGFEVELVASAATPSDARPSNALGDAG